MRFPVALSVTALLLAGCATSRPAPVVPPRVTASPPRPAPAPSPAPPAAAWIDWPFTPGDWTYRSTPGGSVAEFVPAADATPVTVRCDQARREIQFSLSSGAALTIRTTTLTRTLLLHGRDGEAGMGVALAATDPLLDAIAFSRGRFTLERAERAPLVLPPYAEIGRVIEDCRD